MRPRPARRLGLADRIRAMLGRPAGDLTVP
jgi:hypothetical protein